MRVAIVGGGGAGLACAWLLEQEHDVTLFEADARLGGHAHTIDVDAHGQRFPVDAGFQFFGPGIAYATFNRLLAALHVPLESYPATITLFRSHRGRQVVLPPFRRGCPVWVSLTPSAICDLLRFRRFLKDVPTFLARHDTTITTAEYIDRQRLSTRFTERFLYPLLLSFWCVELEDFKTFAAYNSLFYIGASMSDRFRPPEQLAIHGGMRTYVETLARSLDRAEVRVGTAVERISHDGDAYVVEDSTGARSAFDHVVFATDARQALELVAPLDGADGVSEQLRRFAYFETTIAIHGDRRLMPPSESAWSVVNARWDGTHSSLSIWNPERGLPVFRSWVTYEIRLPEPLYATATYQHLKVTVEHFDAQRRLTQLQGTAGLWFAGLYADDADSHESAIHSAVTIAQQLAPDSTRLRMLLP